MLLSVPDAKASGLLECTEGTFWGLFWHCPPKFLPFAFSPSCFLFFFIFFAVLFFFCSAFSRLCFGGKGFCQNPEDHEIIWKEVWVTE